MSPSRSCVRGEGLLCHHVTRWLRRANRSETVITDISMPFTDTTPGASGGGIRLIDSGGGPIESLAAGPDGSIAWVGTNHRLTLASDAIDLPFGPQAETVPRQSLIPTRTVPGRFTSVAWAIPPQRSTARGSGLPHRCPLAQRCGPVRSRCHQHHGCSGPPGVHRPHRVQLDRPHRHRACARPTSRSGRGC
jgi:hypothetical protein